MSTSKTHIAQFYAQTEKELDEYMNRVRPKRKNTKFETM